jgi:hypothetical protein
MHTAPAYNPGWSKTDAIGYAMLGLILFAYLTARAILVPVVHDEAATFFHYIQLNSYIPWFAMWDANNHILNSALAHASVNLFGDSPLPLRLPNLLHFPLFALYTYRICGCLQAPYLRKLAAAAMLTASFMLEFFALARGYGMSMAWFMAAMWHAWQYLHTGALRHQWYTWAAMLLALLANMSLMNSLTAMGLIFGFYTLLQRRTWQATHIASMVLGGGTLFCAAAYYALKLKVLGLLYTGSIAGLVKATAFSFARFQFDLPHLWFALVLTCIGAAACLWLLWRFLSGNGTWTMGRLAAMVLLANALAAVFLEILLNVNYPEERTAIYFVPLFVLAIAFAADEAAQLKPALALTAMPLLYFPIECAATANVYTSHLWYDLHIPEALYQRAEEAQRQSQYPLRVSGRNMYALAWPYRNLVHGSDLQAMEPLAYPDPTAHLLVAWNGYLDFTSLQADTLYFHPKTGFALLQPKGEQIAPYDSVVTFPPSHYKGDAPYHDIAQWMPLQGKHGELWLSWRATQTDAPIHGQVVITAQDSTGNTLYYDYLPLHWIRKHWHGETYHMRRGFHLPEGTSRALAYFWNIGKRPAHIEFFDARLNPQMTHPTSQN